MKHSFDQVQKLFHDKGYKLISKEYNNNKEKLDYYCEKHDFYAQISYIRLKNLTTLACKKCRKEYLKENPMKHITFSEVKQIFEQKGYQLLEKDYTSSSALLQYRCLKHDNDSKISYTKLIQNNLTCEGCQIDKYGSSNKKKTIEIAKKIFQDYGYILLSKKYVNVTSPLEMNCPKHDIDSFSSYELMAQGKSSCTECIREKTIKTNQERRGVDYASQCVKIKQKIAETRIDRYGNGSLEGYDKINAKRKATVLEKFGVEYHMQNEEIKNKAIKTCLDKYGTEWALQNKSVQEKSRQTLLKNYGVSHPMHSYEILKNWTRSCFKIKDYVLPSGNIITCQGYEPFCFDELLKEGVQESEFSKMNQNIPTVAYSLNNEQHIYHPDIYLSAQNKLIEVKSCWSLRTHLDATISKLKACRDANFNVELRIYSRKGERIPILNFIEDYLKLLDRELKKEENLKSECNKSIKNLIISYLNPQIYFNFS